MFETDLQTGELRRAGVRVKLQSQPFRVLALLLERPGEIVTREEIVQRLWGNDTFVDFDQSVGAVIRRLRRALGDSAAAPRYIETVRLTGYRFLLPVETQEAPCRPLPVSAAGKRVRRFKLGEFGRVTGLIAAMRLALMLVSRSGHESRSTGPARLPVAKAAADRSRNIEAWLACQKGRYLWKTRSAAGLKNSIRYFQQALQLDPDYAPAHSGLADAYAILNFYTGRQRNAPVELARAASRRALKLDRSMAEAHATEAYIKFYDEWNWPAAEDAFRKAIVLNPDYATARQWYAEYLFFMGRFDEALREINRAHELDPQSVVIGLQLASPYMFSKQYSMAIEKIWEGLRLNPEFTLGIYMLGTCYEQLGRFEEALAEYKRISGTTLGLTGLGYVYGRSGRQQQARQILQRLLDDSRRDDMSAYHAARVYAGLGKTEQALAWLEKARQARDERMVMLKVDPKLDTLRSEPRFSELVRSLGMA